MAQFEAVGGVLANGHRAAGIDRQRARRVVGGILVVTAQLNRARAGADGQGPAVDVGYAGPLAADHKALTGAAVVDVQRAALARSKCPCPSHRPG